MVVKTFAIMLKINEYRQGNKIFVYKSLNETYRKKLLKNANYICEYCNDRFYSGIHHKNKNRKDNRPENLIVVCRICHRLLDGNIIKIE